MANHRSLLSLLPPVRSGWSPRRSANFWTKGRSSAARSLTGSPGPGCTTWRNCARVSAAAA